MLSHQHQHQHRDAYHYCTLAQRLFARTANEPARDSSDAKRNPFCCCYYDDYYYYYKTPPLPQSLRPVLNHMHNTYIALHLEFLYRVGRGGCYVLVLNPHRFHVPAALSGIFGAFVNSVNVRYGTGFMYVACMSQFMLNLCQLFEISHLRLRLSISKIMDGIREVL